MSAKHTATPWRVAADGLEITTSPLGVLESSKKICDTGSSYKDEEEAKANAAFIVRACNAHDDLVRELIAAEKIILAMLNVMTPKQKAKVHAKLAAEGVSDEGMTRYHERRAALAKAKGGAA